MIKNGSLLICVFSLLVLSGCANQIARLDGYEKNENGSILSVVDERPKEERESEILSLLVSSCDYGIRRLGDDITVPDKIELLKTDLVNQLDLIDKQTIYIKHYTVYFNKSRALHGSMSKISTGMIPDILNSMGSECPEEKTTAGWYSGTDVTTPYSPIIIDMDVVFNRRKYLVRSVYSPSFEIKGAFGEPIAAKTLFAALRVATNKLVSLISDTKQVK